VIVVAVAGAGNGVVADDSDTAGAEAADGAAFGYHTSSPHCPP